MHAFREAVEAGDVDAASALLADDVVFRSPAVFTPYEGRAVVEVILRAVFETLQDFRYTDALDGDGDASALVFSAAAGDRTLEGVDLIRLDAAGRIRELTVFVRPRSGLDALADAMAERLRAATG